MTVQLPHVTSAQRPLHPRLLFATAARVLRQLRSDHRTVAMILVIPMALMILLYFMFSERPALPSGQRAFDVYAAPLLGILPFVIMFLITSITMLRERASGTLERLLTTPIGRADLVGGYALAFSVTAIAQAVLASVTALWPLDLQVAGPGWMLVAVAVAVALLGVGLGMLCSAFAHSEFQTVQFLPVVVIPQLLLCGLFVPRDQLPRWLEVVSNVMPLSYAVDAVQAISATPGIDAAVWRDLGVVVGVTILALALGAATLRRRTA